MRARASWRTVSEGASLIRFVGLVGVLILSALIVLGLALVGASRLVGLPLPTVHDDPERAEVGGLALAPAGPS